MDALAVACTRTCIHPRTSVPCAARTHTRTRGHTCPCVERPSKGRWDEEVRWLMFNKKNQSRFMGEVLVSKKCQMRH